VIVYDGHCHVASTELIPHGFTHDVAGNVTARLTAMGLPAETDRIAARYAQEMGDHLADRLIVEMDAAGVDRSVLLYPDFGLTIHGAPAPPEMAARHREIIRRHPGRFWGFLGVDPRRGEDGVAEFSQALDAGGIDGIKLYPPCGYSPSDRRLYPYYEICAARRMPVFVHTGPSARRLDNRSARPVLVDSAARDFPTVPFILGHAGLTHVGSAAELAAARFNVYLDIGGFGSTPTLPDWKTHLNRLFRLGVNHKIVFGTDWPLGRRAGGLKRLVREVVDGPVVLAGVGRRETAMLLHENLLRVLPPHSRP
jgi:predicted TIM-barrel fold metal-dependent hydrolase